MKASLYHSCKKHIKTIRIYKSESHSVMSNSLRPHGLCSPWTSPGQNTGVGSLSLLQEIFPTQGSNPDLPHCRQILYQLSHQKSPRILEWVAYPFSRGSFWPRNGTEVSSIAGRYFTNSYQGNPSKWLLILKPQLQCLLLSDSLKLVSLPLLGSQDISFIAQLWHWAPCFWLSFLGQPPLLSTPWLLDTRGHWSIILMFSAFRRTGKLAFNKPSLKKRMWRESY